MPLEDGFDDFFGHEVGQAEVGAGDGHEHEHHGRGLEDLRAVGPLYALELGPAGTQEANDAVAFANGSAGGLLGADAAAGAPTTWRPAPRGAGGFLKLIGSEVALAQGLGLDFGLGERFG